MYKNLGIWTISFNSALEWDHFFRQFYTKTYMDSEVQNTDFILNFLTHISTFPILQ